MMPRVPKTLLRNFFSILVNICVLIIAIYFVLTFYYGNEVTSFFSRAISQRSLHNYKEQSIKKSSHEKQNLLLFIGIFSAPRLIFRRNALRRSWLSQCKKYNVSCWIFTDAQDVNGKSLPSYIHVPLKQEQFLHNDLVLAESPGGINFARRYLWMLNWANGRYTFEYFLRVDDDYFICLERLLLELPFRPKEKLYWGHVHCEPKGGIRVDEGFVIVSNDLAQTFLEEENKSLLCHPYGDQAMAMWINNIPGVTYFGDPRVHHNIPSKDQLLWRHRSICGDFLALHGTYPVEMELLWFNYRSRTPSRDFTIPGITYPCGNDSKTYDKNSFLGQFHGEPAPCKNKPVWNIADYYPGRTPQTVPKNMW